MSGGGEHLKDEGSRQQVVIAGAIAGLVSRFCIAPLDVIKIRRQLQIHSLGDPLNRPRHFKSSLVGSLPTVKEIFREEGVTGFWKGNIPAELLYITYGSVQFTFYRLVTQTLHALPLPVPIPSPVESFISGGIAGAAATTATYPLDLLRTRFAAQGPQKVYQNLFGSIVDISRHEGYKGFFQGLSAGVAQVVPYMGLFFSTYEVLRPVLGSLDLSFGTGDAIAGVIASVFAKSGTFPLDLIRKRMQVQGPMRERFGDGRVPVYGRGIWRAGRAIVQREGWRGLYRGLTIGLVKAAPASAVTMWTYERTLKELKGWGIREE